MNAKHLLVLVCALQVDAAGPDAPSFELAETARASTLGTPGVTLAGESEPALNSRRTAGQWGGVETTVAPVFEPEADEFMSLDPRGAFGAAEAADRADAWGESGQRQRMTR